LGLLQKFRGSLIVIKNLAIGLASKEKIDFMGISAVEGEGTKQIVDN